MFVKLKILKFKTNVTVKLNFILISNTSQVYVSDELLHTKRNMNYVNYIYIRYQQIDHRTDTRVVFLKICRQGVQKSQVKKYFMCIILFSKINNYAFEIWILQTIYNNWNKLIYCQIFLARHHLQEPTLYLSESIMVYMFGCNARTSLADAIITVVFSYKYERIWKKNLVSRSHLNSKLKQSDDLTLLYKLILLHTNMYICINCLGLKMRSSP